MLLLYCYVNGKHNGAIEIKSSAKSVAAAIMYYGQNGDLMITDIMDMPVVSTNGWLLDQWYGNGVSFTLGQLRKEILPMQFGITEYSEKDFKYKYKGNNKD